MGKEKILGVRYLFLFVFILIAIATLPLYFYINSELQKNWLLDKILLEKYAQKVAYQIYQFSNSYDKEFFFPRSSIYTSAIYDENETVIFSLFEKPIVLIRQNMTQKDGYTYLKYRLKENVFHATYLLVGKKISYLPIISNVLFMLIFTVALLFIATLFLVKQSSEPYKKFNKYLENFIKDAMHEMKTPIGVILLNLDGLDATYPKNKMIQRAKSALKNMVVVYQDLEFFVRENKVEHPKEHINLSLFVKERIEFFKDLLESKEILVNKEIEPLLHVEFSQLELARVIDNTLSNAIKYSKNSTVITVKVFEEKEKIYLQIHDQGKGIKNKEKVFDRYYRGDKISGGFGIGLSIVKTICDKNFVAIELESSPKEGSTFTFIF